MKDLRMCKDCGQPIRAFKYALPDWLCRYCYQAKFPERAGAPTGIGALSKKSRIADEDSYRFLKAHLYDKPGLYEPGFRQVRDYSMLLRNFTSLGHLLDFVRAHRRCVSEVKQELTGLARTHRWLFPRIMEILLLVLWDDLVDNYGKSERFTQGYMDLVSQILPATADPDDAPDSAGLPPVAQNGVWNYQGSNILSAAVAKGAVSRLEAEVVMEVVVYGRDWFDIQEILGVSTGQAFALYESGLAKLGRWAQRHVLVLPGGQIICD